MPYLGVLGSNFEKLLPYFEFALLQSLVQKIKILKFRTKNARFEDIIVIFEIGTLEFV